MKGLGKVRLTSLPMVNRIVDARAEQFRHLDALQACTGTEPLSSYAYYVITVDGQRMDDAMLALVKPVIEREINGRIAAFDRDLEALGVDLTKDA